MKKNFNVEEATEITLSFNDGKSLNLIFNVKALLHLNDKGIGGMKGLINLNVPECCAKIIYLTAKAAGEDITLAKSRAVVSNMKPTLVSEIVKEWQESYVGTIDDETQKKTLEQIITKLAK